MAKDETCETGQYECPWCGYSDPDTWELDLGDGELSDTECHKCTGLIQIEASCTTTYTTRRLSEYGVPIKASGETLDR